MRKIIFNDSDLKKDEDSEVSVQLEMDETDEELEHVFSEEGLTIEAYLKILFKKYGVYIFNEDYNLFLKLLNEFPNEPLRSDVYNINTILGGNVFYGIVFNCINNEESKISRATYNTVIEQACIKDRFWKNNNHNTFRFEELLRMLFEVAGLDVSDIPKRMEYDSDRVSSKIELIDELKYVNAAYQDKNYKTVIEKGTVLFEKGMHSVANVLGKVYYDGYGIKKDYNKSMYYLTYPHSKSRNQDIEERVILEELLSMRDNTMYSSLFCIIGSVLVLLFMCVTKFFISHTALAIIGTLFLIAGSVVSGIIYKKKYIFDFSYYFFLLGCMFFGVLIL